MYLDYHLPRSHQISYRNHMMERLPFFIEEVYNQKKLHSALDYQSPNDFEETLFIQQNNTAPC